MYWDIIISLPNVPWYTKRGFTVHKNMPFQINASLVSKWLRNVNGHIFTPDSWSYGRPTS